MTIIRDMIGQNRRVPSSFPIFDESDYLGRLLLASRHVTKQQEHETKSSSLLQLLPLYLHRTDDDDADKTLLAKMSDGHARLVGTPSDYPTPAWMIRGRGTAEPGTTSTPLARPIVVTFYGARWNRKLIAAA